MIRVARARDVSPGSMELSSQTLLDDQNVREDQQEAILILKKIVSSQTPDHPPLAAILVVIERVISG